MFVARSRYALPDPITLDLVSPRRPRLHLLTEILEDDANHLMLYLRPEIPEDGTDHLMLYPSLEVRGAMPFNSSARRDAVPVASSLTLHMANRLSSCIKADPRHSPGVGSSGPKILLNQFRMLT
ncbi:hypothetical protein B296_00042808 [Ensete ventricosum]|uniref:Uncharacterized protein n=1 Tax=Ensete ventricosum TaxID=4639 RepID=A0A426XWF2_ENSVE|nr:hypothetical protein B296_00042808 [Ensete ventricosum]